MITLLTQLRQYAGLAIFATALSVAGAQEKQKPASVDTKSAPAAKDRAKEGLERAKEQANEQRDRFLKEFEALQKQLKDATEEQRKQIMEKIQAQRKEFERANGELQRQIRDEQRRQRQVKSGG